MCHPSHFIATGVICSDCALTSRPFVWIAYRPRRDYCRRRACRDLPEFLRRPPDGAGATSTGMLPAKMVHPCKCTATVVLRRTSWGAGRGSANTARRPRLAGRSVCAPVLNPRPPGRWNQWCAILRAGFLWGRNAASSLDLVLFASISSIGAHLCCLFVCRPKDREAGDGKRPLSWRLTQHKPAAAARQGHGRRRGRMAVMTREGWAWWAGGAAPAARHPKTSTTFALHHQMAFVITTGRPAPRRAAKSAPPTIETLRKRCPATAYCNSIGAVMRVGVGPSSFACAQASRTGTDGSPRAVANSKMEMLQMLQ
jgi:hypothetical protein